MGPPFRLATWCEGGASLIAKLLSNLYFLLALLLLPYGYNCFYMVYASFKYKPRKPRGLENHPVVTVQLPIFNERYVISRLMHAVCSIEWPRGRLQIQILDDSSDDTSAMIDDLVEKFRSDGHEIQTLRRETREGFKAGALKNALKHTSGKYIAIFDADFVPPSNFLQATIPLMEEDENLGIVQTRWGHINRNYNKLTEAFALGIDGHHIVEQSGRSALGMLMNFNGSCGVLRKKAILDAGGWASDTLSEDMDLSYRIQLRGWKATYLRDLVVSGEVPPSIAAFRSQQARWAKGSIQCSRKLLGLIWRSDRFTITQKLQATIHMSYYVIHPLFLMMLLLAVPLLALDAFDLVPFWAPYVVLFGLCAFSSFTMYFTSIRKQNMSLKEKLPYLGLLSLIGYGLSARCSLSVVSGLLESGGVFERTPKYDIRSKCDDWRTKLYQPFCAVSFIETLLMLYALVGMSLAYVHGIWSMLFYLSVYFMGYLSIAYFMNIPKYRKRDNPI